MALDLTLLTTRAECDEVLADLAAELDGYDNRDTNLAYADRRTTRTADEVTGLLAGVNAEIASFTATLAQAGIPAKLRKATQSKLRKANDRKDNLTERGEGRTGAAAFLANVDSDQIDAQVRVLTNAQTIVTAHKDTLPA